MSSFSSADSSGASNQWTKTISITSGKGGVGKTTLTCNVAALLAKQGKKVLILDGDLGMANVDIMFGKKIPYNIMDVLDGKVSVEEALVEVQDSVFVLSGGSGVKDLQKINEFQRRLIIDQVTELPMHFDYLLIDTAPGIDDNVLYLNAAAQDVNVIITPDPSSLIDSYALIKVLNKFYKQYRFSIICNMVRDTHEGAMLFRKFSDICSEYLDVSLDFKGSIPRDENFRKATKLQQLVVQSGPGTVSSRAVGQIADKMSGFNDMEEIQGGIQFFWKHLFSVA